MIEVCEDFRLDTLDTEPSRIYSDEIEFSLDPDFDGLNEEFVPICKDYVPGQYVSAI